METPRSNQRKSKVCYEEDDFLIEEFNHFTQKTKPAILTVTRKSHRSSNDEYTKKIQKSNSGKNINKKVIESESSEDSSDRESLRTPKSHEKLKGTSTTKGRKSILELETMTRADTDDSDFSDGGSKFCPTDESASSEDEKSDDSTYENKMNCFDSESDVEIIEKPIRKLDKSLTKPVRKEKGERDSDNIMKSKDLSTKHDSKKFRTPKSNRRKSKVCNKEDDSFIEEFNLDSTPKTKDNEEIYKSNSGININKKVIESESCEDSSDRKSLRTPKSHEKLKGTSTTRKQKSILGTPMSSKALVNQKTPHRLRIKIKKKLETMTHADTDDSNFSDDGSKFCPTDESASSEDEKSDDSTYETKSNCSDSKSDVEIIEKPIRKLDKSLTKPVRKEKGERDSDNIMKSKDLSTKHDNKKFKTPKSNRRKSKVYYKEDDSFIQEFNLNSTPKTKPTRLTMKRKSHRSSSEDTTKYKDEEEIHKSNNNTNIIKKVIESELCEDSSDHDVTSPVKLSIWCKYNSKHLLCPRVILQDISYSKIAKDNCESPLGNSGVRRGMRLKHKAASKAEEASEMLQKLSVNNAVCSDTDEDMEQIERPTSLFADGDVERKQLFGFKSIHRKQDMARNVMETVLGTPATRGRKSLLGTPKSTKALVIQKTPHRLRVKMKKQLETMTRADINGSDVSDSGSEFCPSDESASSEDEKSDDSTDESISDCSDSESGAGRKTKPIRKPDKPLTKPVRKGSLYIMKSEDYSTMHDHKKFVVNMETPRSNRRKSKVCYKEDDSFIEDFNYDSTPKTKPTRLTMTRKSHRSSSDDTTKYEDKEEIHKSNSAKNINRKVIESESCEDSSDHDVSSPVKLSNWCEYNSKHLLCPRVILQDISYSKIAKDNCESPLGNSGVRRGMRLKHKAASKAEEASEMLQKLSVNNAVCSDTDEDMEQIERPTSLFADGDVEGKQLFGFKSIHRKQDMARKAMETVLDSPKHKHGISMSTRTPKSHLKLKGTPATRGRKSLLGTPKSSKTLVIQKTPHRLRVKMKKQLETMARANTDGSDFSDSDSEFCPSDESASSEDEQSNDSTDENKSDSSDCESDFEVKKKPSLKPDKPLTRPVRRGRGERDANYIMKSDDYFTMHGSKKVVTSNHTLERLKTPRLTEDSLQAILNNQKMTSEHQQAIQELLEDHQKLFNKWIYALSEGFSILLHGVGTKQKLIQEFQAQKLSQHPCIVINGFFPSLTLKDILESIMIDLLGLRSIPVNAYEAVDTIEQEMSNFYADKRLFLLIHNIDGSMLRNHKSQHILSKLSKIKNIHLVASIDYINAPLIWDHSKLSNFNFLWWDVTTMLPYTQETSYESSLLVHKSGALALSSLKNVFQSLTTNARGIFMIIVKNQLKNKKTPHFQGISFKDLYSLSRDAFLVSSDHALRAQLTEFLDHKLLKTKRTPDGVENLNIPIDSVLLEEFIENEAEESK